jgi:hypothetical protein
MENRSLELTDRRKQEAPWVYQASHSKDKWYKSALLIADHCD